MMRKIQHNHGATLVEVLVASAVLILAVTGILLSYLRCMTLTETARNMSRAVHAAQSRMDLIRSTPYISVASTYDGVGFAITDLNGYGVSYVDNSQPDLLEIVISVSWKQKNGRTSGEDENLNGALDSGEDVNANGILDSPVLIRDRMYMR